MSAARDQQLRRLLELALDRPASARRSALEEVCDDPRLVAEALALVAQEGELGDFLETPAYARLEATGVVGQRGPVASEGSGPRAPGDRIGRYTLLELLGEGGMGQVFLARQTEPVERQVALKLVRGSLGDAEARGRLLAERRALARLHHPNVAHLFDAATTADGHPYFVMELVAGPPLTEYCDRHRLDVNARLELFIAVCQGVQHAHHKQLLHRDLKPSNILVAEVDGRPVPKIIDFGIAKALDHPLSEEPMTGDRAIGTPSYMSPEALTPLRHDLDTRADIFALGVLLHELLAGCRPFAENEKLPPAELLARLARREAQPPSQRFAELEAEEREAVARRRGTSVGALRQALQADLDWIVLKAIARRREERYASAAELAADVERFLRHEPVLAHPGGVGYGLGRWLRRHRVAATLAATGVLGVVAAVLFLSLSLVRAGRPEPGAGSPPAGSQPVDAAPGASDPSELADALGRLGLLELEAQRFEEAAEHLRRSLEIQTETLAPDDLRIAETRAAYAAALRHLGRFLEASELAGAAPGDGETGIEGPP